MPASESKETDFKKRNHLTHVLNSPKTFIRMFTREHCTTEEKQIQEILKPICALRNCGGGVLTILFIEICLKSEAEKCVDIIKNAVGKALSDTTGDDLLVCIHPRSIIFLARGSKKIVKMKYNLYFMTDSSLEFVSSKKSAEDIKLFLQKQDELSTEHEDFTEQLPTRLFKIEKVRKIRLEKVIDQISLVKGEQINEPSVKERVTFRILKEDKFSTGTYENSAAFRIALERNELLQHVSAYANHKGGTLFYGVNSDGTVVGEKMSRGQIQKIRETVKKKMASLVGPQHAHKHDKFWKIGFIPVEDELKNDSDLNLYVIKISVKPCPGGVFIDEPESYYVVENRVEKLSFSKWMAHLRNSTTETSFKTSFIEFQGTVRTIITTMNRCKQQLLEFPKYCNSLAPGLIAHAKGFALLLLVEELCYSAWKNSRQYFILFFNINVLAEIRLILLYIIFSENEKAFDRIFLPDDYQKTLKR